MNTMTKLAIHLPINKEKKKSKQTRKQKEKVMQSHHILKKVADLVLSPFFFLFRWLNHCFDCGVKNILYILQPRTCITYHCSNFKIKKTYIDRY